METRAEAGTAPAVTTTTTTAAAAETAASATTTVAKVVHVSYNSKAKNKLC